AISHQRLAAGGRGGLGMSSAGGLVHRLTAKPRTANRSNSRMLSPELDCRADRFVCAEARCVERGESERGDGVLALQTAEHRRAVVRVMEPRAARGVQPPKLVVERARQT